jgi:hypothetical protein
LWTPRLQGIERLEPLLNDFRLIADAPDALDRENEQSMRWLEEVVCPDDIVVSQHLPSPRSTHARHAGSPINCFFVCDIEHLIVARQPRLWIHGHTHESMDYRIGCTRVLCNPYGYEGVETNPSFDRSLVLPLATGSTSRDASSSA